MEKRANNPKEKWAKQISRQFRETTQWPAGEECPSDQGSIRSTAPPGTAAQPVARVTVGPVRAGGATSSHGHISAATGLCMTEVKTPPPLTRNCTPGTEPTETTAATPGPRAPGCSRQRRGFRPTNRSGDPPGHARGPDQPQKQEHGVASDNLGRPPHSTTENTGCYN